jgi:phenylacetate-coenzyme A ligase PaaK-like adenylate-forming protein
MRQVTPRRAATPTVPPRPTKSAHHIKSLIGVTLSVAVKPPGEVPRSQGKAVRVKDLRQATK